MGMPSHILYVNPNDTVVSCRACPKIFSVPVKKSAIREWRSGVYIQDAMPHLDAGLREALISGICPSCWTALFEV